MAGFDELYICMAYAHSEYTNVDLSSALDKVTRGPEAGVMGVNLSLYSRCSKCSLDGDVTTKVAEGQKGIMEA